MNTFTALLSGLIFGFGLLLSGMSNPAKVLGFLDLAGAWDPSLALVMGGAVAVGLAGFGWAMRRTRTLLDGPMQLPTAHRIDPRLILGSLTFGIGWGIAGICPGPGLVLLGTAARGQAWIFVLAMLAGMLGFEALQSRRRAGPLKPP